VGEEEMRIISAAKTRKPPVYEFDREIETRCSHCGSELGVTPSETNSVYSYYDDFYECREKRYKFTCPVCSKENDHYLPSKEERLWSEEQDRKQKETADRLKRIRRWWPWYTEG
jgi:hypothetical protein